MTKIEALQFQIANLERIGKGESPLCWNLKKRLAKEQAKRKRDSNGRFASESV